jgi:predicted DNA binding CopG/RHH family protein
LHVKFLTLASLPRAMLHAMQQPMESAPSPAFAGFLAALAGPEQATGVPGDGTLSMKWKPAPSWNDDDLAGDVAILSYESALKAHARYRPSQVSDRSLTQSANAEPFCYEDASATTTQPATRSIADLEPRAISDLKPSLFRTAPVERDLKDASITIRMSKAECAQLHRRASEAGLTISAYLRSCTFEAESLRAMVKDTLAQLRAATSQAKPPHSAPSLFSRMAGWLARLITPWHVSQRASRA